MGLLSNFAPFLGFAFISNFTKQLHKTNTVPFSTNSSSDCCRPSSTLPSLSIPLQRPPFTAWSVPTSAEDLRCLSSGFNRWEGRWLNRWSGSLPCCSPPVMWVCHDAGFGFDLLLCYLLTRTPPKGLRATLWSSMWQHFIFISPHFHPHLQISQAKPWGTTSIFSSIVTTEFIIKTI